jgi:hypothetical protein
MYFRATGAVALFVVTMDNPGGGRADNGFRSRMKRIRPTVPLILIGTSWSRVGEGLVQSAYPWKQVIVCPCLARNPPSIPAIVFYVSALWRDEVALVVYCYLLIPIIISIPRMSDIKARNQKQTIIIRPYTLASFPRMVNGN